MPNQDIAADATELTVPLQVNKGTRPGVYTVTVIGQAQVPFAKDPKATTRPNTLVSLPSWPIQVTVTEAPRK